MNEIHYPVLDCDQEAWKSLPFRMDGDLIISRHSNSRILTLPLFPTMYDFEVERVCEAIKNWSGN